MGFITPASSAGPSNLPTLGLPPLSTLHTWTHRPQALTKCFISDVYRMRTLINPVTGDFKGYTARDVFLLDQWPCRFVQIVAWVAGVDHKESTMTVTLDDGDGLHVLPVLIRLSRKTRPDPSLKSKAKPTSSAIPTGRFLSARERANRPKSSVSKMEVETKEKEYERKDICVGDVVRINGKIDEWSRKRDGVVEWVRQVIIDDASGGSIEVVDPDEQYIHTSTVLRLHRETYSKPFHLPPPPKVVSMVPASPTKSVWSQGMEGPSEAYSELSIDGPELKLRDPAKLRSSQLTDVTYRQYLLDYMDQETVRTLREMSPQEIEGALAASFPEYKPSRKGKEKPFTISTRHNSQEDPNATPRTFRRKDVSVPISPCIDFNNTLEPFTIASLLSVPHLNQLARLVVDSEAKKEERRRRRRLMEGSARPKDLEVERRRVENGLERDEWRLSEEERLGKMRRLTEWVIRNVAEEGSLVSVRLHDERPGKRSKSLVTQGGGAEQRFGEGYLPLPPNLLLPLLIPLITAEKSLRSKIFLRKNDPKRLNGVTLSELVTGLRKWGEEGRWERVGEWKVQEAVLYGVEIGVLRGFGEGWWVEDGFG